MNRMFFMLIVISFYSSIATALEVHEYDMTEQATRTLSWVAPTERVDGSPILPGEIAGYRIYSGSTEANFVAEAEVAGNVLSYEFALLEGTTLYAITAVGARGIESALSVIKTVVGYIPKPPMLPPQTLEVN